MVTCDTVRPSSYRSCQKARPFMMPMTIVSRSLHSDQDRLVTSRLSLKSAELFLKRFMVPASCRIESERSLSRSTVACRPFRAPSSSALIWAINSALLACTIHHFRRWVRWLPWTPRWRSSSIDRAFASLPSRMHSSRTSRCTSQSSVRSVRREAPMSLRS